MFSKVFLHLKKYSFLNFSKFSSSIGEMAEKKKGVNNI